MTYSFFPGKFCLSSSSIPVNGLLVIVVTILSCSPLTFDSKVTICLPAILLKEPFPCTCQSVFRVTTQRPGYSFKHQKSDVTQVWVRVYNFPLKYRHDQSSFSVVRGVGIPLKIYPTTFGLNLGIYACLLVEIDFLRPLPEKSQFKG